jgi:phytoene dehydrogenase-like protein
VSQTYDIVAVGSGHNGLVAAAYLAAAGKKVLVVERNAWFGGGVVSRELTVPGFRHDQHSVGHIFIQANPLIRNDELKLKAKYGLKYHYPEIPVLSVFDDGSSIRLYRDRQKNYQELARFSKEDAESYLKLSQLAEGYLPMLIGTLYSAPAPVGAGYAMMDQSPQGRELFGIMMRSSWDIITQYFKHDKIRLHFGRMVGENLASPEDQCSGIGLFLFLAYLEKYGMGIAEGGSGALTASLIRCIEDHGGEVRANTDVEQILVTDRRASGIRLAGGEVITAKDAVIGAIHPHLLGRLVQGVDSGVAAAAARTKTSDCACFTVHAALNEKLRFRADVPEVDQAAFIELLRTDTVEFRRSFDDVRYGQIPSYPLIGLISPTNTDPTRAPAGKATLHAWDYVPYEVEGRPASHWDGFKQAYAEQLIGEMGKYIANLDASNLIAYHCDSPLDMERTSASFQRGDLHGIAGYVYQFGAHRPTPELGRGTVPGLDRFYLVGPFQHPGGGVFGAGRFAAMKACEDLKINFEKTVAGIR